MKYVIYLRVSTDQQVHSGLGIEAQRDLCKKYIDSEGQCEFIEFIDEGYSGALKMEKRPALMEALNILEKDDVLLVAKRDRLGRDTMVNILIESFIERKKAKLISASGDFKSDDDPGSLLMKRMVDAFAEYERLIIGARTKAAMQVKKRKGERCGYIPYGYRLSLNGKNIEPDEYEQEILKEIYEMKDKCSLRYISDELNRKKYKNRNGDNWQHNAVWMMVKRGNIMNNSAAYIAG